MLITNLFLITWLMGFLLIFTRFEKSTLMQDGAFTVDREKRLQLGLGLAAYVGISLALGITYILAS